MHVGSLNRDIGCSWEYEVVAVAIVVLELGTIESVVSTPDN